MSENMGKIMPENVTSRLLSLDVFRGITIAAMILVNSPGNQTAYAFLEHAEWNGCTPTDLIFPFFLFIVGVSLVFSLTKRLERGDPDNDILLQVVKRSLIIFGLGLLLNGFPYYDLTTLRIPGVLQRIALCYLAAAIVFLKTRPSPSLPLPQGGEGRGEGNTLSIIVVLLVGYWIAMTTIQVPGYGVGDLGMEGNLAAYIDRMFLAGHIYKPVYDPEGILSTLPAIATTLLGNLAGVWLLSRKSVDQKAGGLIIAGTAALAAGWLWGRVFPINKALWTSSYVLWTGGWALYLLAFLYWVIDVKDWKRWSKPFEIFGVNAIAAYLLHILFLKIQNRIPIPRLDGSPGNLRLYLSEHLFGWTSLENASLLYALGYTFLWLIVLGLLYRRKIFLKV
jgi:predicted acyltransferase